MTDSQNMVTKISVTLTRCAMVWAFMLGMFSPIVSAQAKTVTASEYVVTGKLVGQTRLTFLHWKVYDAYLYTPTGKWKAGKPFSLKLTYLRNFKGKAIAKRSVQEIKKQGMTNQAKLANWGKRMTAIFPNVKKGASLVGVVDNRNHTTFYYQGKKVGAVNDPEFTQWFFNIWLGKNTSEPKLRKELLGLV